MSVRDLIDKYDRDITRYQSNSYNETLLRSDFLDPLFALLGWDIRNTAGKSVIDREVILEEALSGAPGTHSKKPDYTFRLFSIRKFFLEAKKPHVHIQSDNDSAKQVRRYGFTAGLSISVLSNFEYLAIYQTTDAVKSSDTYLTYRIKLYHYKDYESKFDEIKSLLGRDAVYDGTFDNTWSSVVGHLDRPPIEDMFLGEINQWRLSLGREFLSADPSIEIDDLGDFVQSYINKILFLRVCEDRNIESYQNLLGISSTGNHNLLIEKFREADRKYNSGLFDEELGEAVIQSSSSYFWAIIRQLYYPNTPYDFAVLSSDILGSIYEIFLSQRLVLSSGVLSLEDKPENVDKDIVTTPAHIIGEIIDKTVTPRFTDKDIDAICSLSIADIACGSGAFLLAAYQSICDLLVDYYSTHDPSQLIGSGVGLYKLKFEAKLRILENCIFGVDVDFKAVEATKFALLLKLLENEDVSSLPATAHILPDLSNNIIYGNSLVGTADVSTRDADIVVPYTFTRLFDIVIGNPPYMKTEDMRRFTPKEHAVYPSIFDSAKKQYDKYFLFIEKALSLLSPHGVVGFIVPCKFMKVGSAEKLRGLITTGNHVSKIISFGAEQIFDDKSTYSCILILSNDANSTFDYSEILNLDKWLVHDADAIDTTTISSTSLDGNVWTLVPNRYQAIYDKIISSSTTLESIVTSGHIFNGIQTSANDIYVFTPTAETSTHYQLEDGGTTYQIEKALTRPYYETSREDGAYTYNSFKPNAVVIYPYVKDSTSGIMKLVDINTLQTSYPGIYSYLLAHKSRLEERDIQPTPATSDEWYRYGRHQSLEACEVDAKMIVGVLSNGDKYVIDKNKTLISSGGTAGYCVVTVPSTSNYSLYYIQAILSSKEEEWIAHLIGEVFKDGFFARGTKTLKQFRIPPIDFSVPEQKDIHDRIVDLQKQLISTGDNIKKYENQKRKQILEKRKFSALKESQDRLIHGLFNLSEAEVLLIPIHNGE